MLFIVSTVFPCRLVFLSINGGMCTAIYCRQHADCGSEPYTNSLQINTTISNLPKNMYLVKQLHSLKQSQNISIESLHLIRRCRVTGKTIPQVILLSQKNAIIHFFTKGVYNNGIYIFDPLSKSQMCSHTLVCKSPFKPTVLHAAGILWVFLDCEVIITVYTLQAAVEMRKPVGGVSRMYMVYIGQGKTRAGIVV